MRLVDLSGVTLDAEVAGPVVVDFDGQYVWSFTPERDGELVGPDRTTPWPVILLPYLTGTCRVTVHTPDGSTTYVDEEIRFGDSPDRVRIVDRFGHPVAVDKVGHLGRIFSESSSGIKDEIMAGTTRALHDLREICGVEAYLNYGCLLGAIRNGKMVGHDSDSDLCYLSAYTTPVDIILESYRLERKMAELGWSLRRMSGADFKLMLPLSDGRDCDIDVFGAFHINDVFYQLGNRSGHLPRESIVPVSTVTLEGHEFPAPRDPEAMLAFLYGPHWRTPDPSFKYADALPGVERLNGWLRGFRTEMGKWSEFYGSPEADLLPREGSTFAHWVEQRIEPGSPVADLGSGIGSDTVWFHQQGHPVRAFDFSRIVTPVAAERLVEAGAEPDVRKLVLNELRTVMVTASELAHEPVPFHLYARDLVGCLDESAREYLWRLAEMSLRRGGSLFLEFSAAAPGLPDPHPLVRRFSVDWLRGELVRNGLEVTDEESGSGVDLFGNPDPLVQRLVVRRSPAGIPSREDPPPHRFAKTRARVSRRVRPARRLDVLPEKLEDGRQLHRRLAELLDLTVELAVPLTVAEESSAPEVLAAYRGSI
ncbi:MAG: mucin-5AC [Marmoricola sp.]|nr:mucin-5AC [Marmoricola sp.]